MKRVRLAFFTAFVLLLLYTECASGGVDNSGGEIVGGILQGIGAGLSGL